MIITLDNNTIMWYNKFGTVAAQILSIYTERKQGGFEMKKVLPVSGIILALLGMVGLWRLIRMHRNR